MIVHEHSYRGRGLTPAMHRHRLSQLLRLFQHIPLADQGRLADFGCSNGYILALLQQRFFLLREWTLDGFDHSRELLDLADARQLDRAEFHPLDLNVLTNQWAGCFDVVLCLETLEHLGRWENALRNLYRAARLGGYIIISIPNELGLPGTIKYLVRKFIRRRAYGDFFAAHSELRYLLHLLLNRPIAGFRSPPSDHWGPHLGFDWQVILTYLHKQLVSTGKCALLREAHSLAAFNRFFLLKKIA